MATDYKLLFIEQELHLLGFRDKILFHEKDCASPVSLLIFWVPNFLKGIRTLSPAGLAPTSSSTFTPFLNKKKVGIFKEEESVYIKCRTTLKSSYSSYTNFLGNIRNSINVDFVILDL